MSDFEPKPLFNDAAPAKKRETKSDDNWTPHALSFNESTPVKSTSASKQPKEPGALFGDAVIKEANDFKISSDMLVPYEPLTGAEVFMIEKIAAKIDFDRSNKILNYGADIQSQSNEITDKMLELVNNNEMDDVRNKMKMILKFIEELDIAKATKKNLLDNIFKVDKADQLKDRFNTSYKEINIYIQTISTKVSNLEEYITDSGQLLGSIETFLTKIKAYIAAGEIYSNYYKNVKLAKIKEEAGQDIIKNQKVKEVEQMMAFFDKRIHDLRLSQMSLLQSLPQLELIKNNHFKLITRIQSTLLMTIPMWKKQYLTALLLLENNKLDEINESINTVLDTQNEIINSLKEL